MGEIQGVWRTITGVISLGLLLVGGAAVFNTDNELGTAALIVAGALGLVICVIGQVPPFKVGGVEVGSLAAEQVAIEAQVAASQPGATPESVALAAQEALETAVTKAAESAWLLSEFGNSGGVSRVANEEDRSGRMWTVWRRSGKPVRAHYQASSRAEWFEQARRAQEVDRDDEDDEDDDD